MNIALILAGGKGSRLNTDCPKQYIEVNHKPLIAYCFDTLKEHADIDMIWIAADPKWWNYIQGKCVSDKLQGFSRAGGNRQLSIWTALLDLEKRVVGNTRLLIHDAARPLLTANQISSCFEAITGHDGVMPVLPMKDTVYFSADGKKVTSSLKRNQIIAGQAPEAFDFHAYYKANSRLDYEQMCRINGSTEPAIMAGMDIAIIAGDENNFKITTKYDLDRFRWMMEYKGSHNQKEVADEGMGVTWNE